MASKYTTKRKRTKREEQRQEEKTEDTETRWTQNAHTSTHTQTYQLIYFIHLYTKPAGGPSRNAVMTANCRAHMELERCKIGVA